MGDGEAIGLFYLSQGCAVFPNERWQNLCLHHAMKATPIDGIELADDYSQGRQFSKWLEANGWI